MVDLKKVYKANTKEYAEERLLELEAHEVRRSQTWGKKYPIVLKSWNNNWEKLSAFFAYSPDIRRVIYTTNIVEGSIVRFVKSPKLKVLFPQN